MSLVKIATACAVECERQDATEVSDLRNLLNAYERVLAFGPEMFNCGAGFVRLAMDVEPRKNDGYGFRITPVTFQNGGDSASPSEIPRLMQRVIDYIEEINDLRTEGAEVSVGWIHEVTQEFLWIHPFEDGNGRIGFLLYNYLMGTLDEPLALPDFGW